jgi:hypothetical protein
MAASVRGDPDVVPHENGDPIFLVSLRAASMKDPREPPTQTRMLQNGWHVERSCHGSTTDHCRSDGHRIPLGLDEIKPGLTRVHKLLSR